MSHSTSTGHLISTVITSATHHHADINVPSRSVEHMSDVIHVGTREHIIGVVLWLETRGP